MTELPMPIFSKDIKIDPETNIMTIEGKHYRLEYNEHGKPYMIEIDVKKFNKTVQKIMEKTKVNIVLKIGFKLFKITTQVRSFYNQLNVMVL